ncbi:MAG: NADP-dependent phosphogluconate dehydrogenase [Candidatus Actinomarina sp.]|jgi:6-phosphogluconate dehydrogenase|tara:strand:+ start:7058 stop:8407 length:1350 start_codon:yes stop_codon:yes gene_type:complete
MLKEIGLIGLGVMGKNIALNLSDNGVIIKAFNNSENKLNDIKKEFKNDFIPFDNLEQFVENLEDPKTILLMVPSGEATKEVIEKLVSLLGEGGTIIDGGNSFYLDSIENGEYLKKNSINFIGMGVSGGEDGARNGPALMVGSETSIETSLFDTLKNIAAKAEVECLGIYQGPGTGHFIKMVHNGIEYSEMQSIAEMYLILKKLNKTNKEISSFFSSQSENNNSSYLIEITSKILQKKDGDEFVIDQIKPIAQNKGTGRLTIQTSLDLDVSIPSISAAYDARLQSNNQYTTKTSMESIDEDISDKNLSDALYFSRVCSMIQGLELITKFSESENHEISIVEVLENWRGGCIIRSNLLLDLKKEFSENNSFYSLDNIFNNLQQNRAAISKVLQITTKNNIPTPVLSASFNWFNNLTSVDNPSNLIQAQRDFFGRHKVQKVDSSEDINIDWD